ncbi:aromatic ring-hydroxylating dioxygenase subunit alpha [Novosphingobium sp. G106]|uniref:aromatic ring-hydroxylating oxygenase subunit alpha n=1 Tax=Novosphingobium sp. G106 TaxID=2849500 RepID=UPI001C2D30AC|nr:aromatic ring-hydroxylating dioxygenase subunit alpha [Novosphingobium sp. G106]MBV1687916.1 aromatic ring-hydroxylating dioxygenase subunit alpha [Novosphingobium sp. G106]
MSQSTEELLDAVPFRVTNPELIPAERYYDPHFFELEKEKLWPHVWQMACRLEEIPEIGDYVEYTNLGKSVLVVRTKNGVKALHNACRHRGVKLATGAGNCAKQGFVCPFHGWRYNLEGKNTFVFGKQIFSEELLDQAEISLQPCRVEFWGGCAFINFDDDAPSLLESLGPVAERLNARHVDQLKMDWWYATELPTNWKLAMEAFQEGYHTMKTHPQLHQLSALGNSYGIDSDGLVLNRGLSARDTVNMHVDFLARLSSGMGGMVHGTEVAVLEKLRDMDVPEDPLAATMAFYARAHEEITVDARARGVPIFDIAKVAQEVEFHAVEFMFPHYFLLPMMGAMSSYRIRPLTPETCLFEIWSLVLRPEGEAYDTPKAPIVLPYDSSEFPEIPQQDYSNLPLQQEGLHAGEFKFMRLSKQHEGMISNYQRLIDGYIAGLESNRLARGAQIVNAGFEGPITDIGF